MPYVRRPSADTSRLADLARHRDDLDRRITDEVARLRHEGASWLDVAEALGTHRQNAHQKYRNVGWDPEAERPVFHAMVSQVDGGWAIRVEGISTSRDNSKTKPSIEEVERSVEEALGRPPGSVGVIIAT
ncbi:MAG: hypothetical protein M0Z30_13275 [Actinomycetota bacterium]|nr:hypothetical protein [Actinomycetota bacterium]